MQDLFRVAALFSNVGNAGEKQRRTFYIVNGKAVQPFQLRAVDYDAHFAVIGNNLDGLHYNTSFPRCGCIG